MTPLPQPPSAGIISPLYLAHIIWRGWFLKRYYYCTYGCVSVHTMTCMEVREQLLQIGSLLSTLHWFQEFCKAFACYSSYQLPPRSSSPPTPQQGLTHKPRKPLNLGPYCCCSQVLELMYVLYHQTQLRNVADLFSEIVFHCAALADLELRDSTTSNS